MKWKAKSFLVQESNKCFGFLLNLPSVFQENLNSNSNFVKSLREYYARFTYILLKGNLLLQLVSFCCKFLWNCFFNKFFVRSYLEIFSKLCKCSENWEVRFLCSEEREFFNIEMFAVLVTIFVISFYFLEVKDLLFINILKLIDDGGIFFMELIFFLLLNESHIFKWLLKWNLRGSL